jgi:dTDP-4-dehydrorhamnose reductase
LGIYAPFLFPGFRQCGATEIYGAYIARAVFDMVGRVVTDSDVTTADYPTPAKRPLISLLDCTISTEAAFGIKRPDWHAMFAKKLTRA